MPLHTHYDNLKVTRNAPPEVVRAAYRVLAQRYHPDVNPSQDAARIMMVINGAYAVLSDPQRRAEHDAWIKDQLITEAINEAMSEVARQRPEQPGRSPAPQSQGSRESTTVPAQLSALMRFNQWMGTPAGTKFGLTAIVGGAFVTWLWATRPPNRTSPPAQITPYNSPTIATPSKPSEARETPSEQAAPKVSSYREFHGSLDTKSSSPQPDGSKTAFEPSSKDTPAWSPNGKPWPDRAAYLDGFRRRASAGLTSMTIDNTNGGADVYVKLCQSSAGKCDGLRHMYIPLGAKFTMRSITPGSYDIRYRALDTGTLAKSQPIQLKQIEETDGIRYSNVTLTLYRIEGGNTSFEGLSEDNF